MQNRILEFSRYPARLKVRYRQLMIESEDMDAPGSVPLEDIAVIICSHPQLVVTQTVLSGLAESGGVMVVCNHNCLPVAMSVPLANHHLGNRLTVQAEAPQPVKKRLWQSIVRAKIRMQSDLLNKVCGDDAGLSLMISRVTSGDPINVEATAARRYWTRLSVVFSEPGRNVFRRNPDHEDFPNRVLNYGYAILRAMVARAISATGLHPSLGIHHHNKYNPYSLADDLMEPFRPMVDDVLCQLVQNGGKHEDQLTLQVKRYILESLVMHFPYGEERRTLFDIMGTLAYSVFQVFEHTRTEMECLKRIRLQNRGNGNTVCPHL